MNTFKNAHAVNLHSVWRTLVKKVSLGLVTLAAVIVLFIVRPDVTSADGCKTTTGQCSISIGLYIG